ncbi:MAG: hypothetical protein ACP5HU_08445 [Phycisphaerae bacterium]
MKTFTDTAGRTWTISLTLGTAMAVKARLGVDLLQPEMPYRDPSSCEASAKQEPLLTRLGTDEMLLGEVLCCLLERQFETHKVSEDDVRAAFDGRTLLAAQQAFYEELIDFFRSRGRNDRAKAVAKQMAMIEAAVTAIETRIDGLDVDTVVGEAMSEPTRHPSLRGR